MALQHESKLRVYRGLKREIGFEEYLQYVKQAPSRLFFNFHLCTRGNMESFFVKKSGKSG